MLSPEVFNFPAPESLFQIEKFEGKVPLNNKSINSFQYSHLVTAIFSDSTEIPKDFEESFVQDSVYYKICNLSLGDLVDVRFISSFVRSGTLALLSINKRIDCDNCIGITSCGRLHLNLTKETYQSLGIDGSPSHFVQKLKNRYVVSVDLADEKLLYNKNKLAKLKSRLQILEKFNVLLSWKPLDEDICPSSIAKYFVDLGYIVKECTPSFNRKTVNSEVPQIDIATIDTKDAADFVEWLGMLSIGGVFQIDHSDYLSSYETPFVSLEIQKQMKCLQWKGFFTNSDIQGLIEGIMKNCNLEKTWMSIYVQGFSDCPVSWSNEEQHYFTNGDNGFILIFDEYQGMICVHKCSKKRYK